MKIKRPNGALYFLIYIIFYPVLKLLFRLKVDRKGYDPPKGPFIVLSNHSSFMDFLLVMLTFYPRRLNAVGAQKFYLYRPLDKFLPMMGCIPKNLFDPDIRSIKGIMQVIKRGGRILLFPEGRCTVDGAYMGMHKSAGKLIKSLGVPVISCHIQGAYTCMPFWRKGLRPGRVYVSLANLFSEADTKALTVDDINSAVDARLSGFDTPTFEKQLRTFRARRLAEGLQNILYLCPKCRSEFTLETKGNTIKCAQCGNAAEMDRTAQLTPAPGSETPESVHDWYKLIAIYEKEKLSEDMEPISEKVTVRIPAPKAGGGMIQAGSGVLRLEPKGWFYDGEISGKQTSLAFSLESVPALPFDPNDDFQIYANGSFYMFTPEDARKCVKYATIGECAYWRFVKRINMTPAHDAGFK